MPPLHAMRYRSLAKLLLAVLAAVLLLSTAACDRSARYQVVTFFFTGVPPIDGEVATVVAADGENQVASRFRPLPRRWDSGPFQHGPYIAQECAGCHEMQPSATPGGIATRIIPGRFALPPGELCVSCHVEKSNVRVEAEGLWLHGPGENCQRCHHPHSSAQPAMLRLAADDLCRSCHAVGFIHNLELHAGIVNCLACHNPHLGRDALLLKADFQESF